MEALLASISDVSVDRIIEKVMIRNSHQPYDYTRRDKQQLTPQEHLWHFQLQEQNVELKNRVKLLRNKFKKKEEQIIKQSHLQKQIEELKKQLQSLLNQNGQLQRDINKMRLKNSQMNESIRDSLDGSINNRKSMRECSCIDPSLSKCSPFKKKIDREKLKTVIDSPSKQTSLTKKDVSIDCFISNRGRVEEHKQKIQRKKEHILALQHIISNQQKLIQSYQRQLSNQADNKVLDKRNTRPSTSRFCPIERPSSMKMLKAGSIVKINRG